ncbi:MAG TPA: VCBS repeat-containing protein, partial [Egibacteraceae bacterium]|nr:VCBS repeat-containing protein [Egibacteraceae bacterium]
MEVFVSSSAPVSKVEVMDDGGAWAAMTYKPEWQSWALSYRIEPGHRVTFRATTAAGVVTSCPFTHPQGVEQCPSSGNPWQQDEYSAISGLGYDLATGDTDGDGRGELYAATELALFEVDQGAVRAVSTLPDWTAVTTGDLDRDGKAEVYGARYSGSASTWEVHRFVRSGSGWSGRIVFAPGSYVSTLTVDDVDRDGQRDLYATGQDSVSRAAAWHLRPTTSGPFVSTRILTVADPWGTAAAEWAWIGDADRDGQVELVVMVAGRDFSEVHMADHTGSWQQVRIGATDDFAGPVVAGDIDGDGKGEVATLGLSLVEVFTFTNGAWSRTVVHETAGIGQDLFLGDGDNDGKQELYILEDRDAWVLRKASGSWSATRIATTPHWALRLIVGDGDRDGIREVFALSFDSDRRLSHITRVQVPATSFDATFSGVRGNEWWVQSMVNGNGQGIAAVDVRLDNGEWRPLARQSWGGWAASYRIV